MEKFATLETTSVADLAVAERVEELLPLLVGRRPLDHRGVQRGAELLELVEVGADHQRRLVGVPLEHPADHRQLRLRGGRDPVPLLGLGDGVGHPLLVVEGDPHLDALGRRDVALRLDVAPRGVVALRADQREDVVLAPVLAHQRGGQAEPAAGLQVGGQPEDRRRQQVHLVVDDQAPVLGVEQVQVPVLALPAGGDHLVGRDGDRPDLLALARSTRRSPPRSARCGRSARASTAARRRCWSPGSAWSPSPRPSPRRRPASCPHHRAGRRRPSRRPRSPRRPPAGSRAGASSTGRARSGAPAPST